MRSDVRAELIQVDTAGPMVGPRQPMAYELVSKGDCRREGPVGRTVEAPHDLPDPRRGDTGSDRHVIRKARVECRGEMPLALEAPASRRPADRSFGRDVDAIGRETVEHARYAAAAIQGEADLGIGRAGDRPEQPRLDD